ncbi:uncharacterized protein LOC116845441 isoform X1 [Odontomachus brunneus]|uniref:uncharacterized protein LOC116845441 isoform X1 n=1 Tax=Odontomachus brunneus TaxID=486640 RepID=UPI0013F19569|nr:uncharacterized protein LOC116845441 isoform X1 [Odontomachus brunneus]
MHPAILDAAGYTLLLSGFITLATLLREGCKHKKRSPFYILSTSDVFSSIVTAIVLLVSHIEAGVRFSYNWQNNTDDTEVDRTWTIKNDGEYKLLFPRARELNREAARDVDSNVTLTCDAKNVFMQYGILLAPLTNALISLLTFAIQCNLNVACVKRRCADAMRSSMSDARLETKHVEVARRRRATSEDQRELASQPSNVVSANIVQKIMKTFRFQTAKQDDKKPASLLVTSHWLVPFLVTAILCFAGYDDMNTVRRTEETECIFESNFPVSFHVFSDAEEIVGSGVHATSLGNYYFIDEKASNKLNVSSVEVNEIISKVQNIVKNALSYIRNSTENTKATNLLDVSRLRNMTDYVVTNNTSIESVTGIDKAEGAQTTNDTVKRIASVYNLSSQVDNHTYFNEDPEILLFHDLLKNASEESNWTTPNSSDNIILTSIQNKNDSYEEDTQTYFAKAEGDTTPSTANISITQNPTFLSDNQIYADILKRIHAASVYTALKHHRNHSVGRFGSKQPKQNNLESIIARIKPNSIADLSKYDHFDHDLDTGTSSSPHMINECFVSNKFLKLHLFVLSFAIYFLPILLCCILQVRGEHACENTLAMLKAKVDLMSILLHGNTDDDDNVVIVKEGTRTEWFSTSSGSTSRQNSTSGFNKSLETTDNHGSRTDIGTTEYRMQLHYSPHGLSLTTRNILG